MTRVPRGSHPSAGGQRRARRSDGDGRRAAATRCLAGAKERRAATGGEADGRWKGKRKMAGGGSEREKDDRGNTGREREKETGEGNGRWKQNTIYGHLCQSLVVAIYRQCSRWQILI